MSYSIGLHSGKHEYSSAKIDGGILKWIAAKITKLLIEVTEMGVSTHTAVSRYRDYVKDDNSNEMATADDLQYCSTYIVTA